MKLINYAESSWLLGDEAADLLIEYSVIMARGANADSVEVRALDADGAPQTVSLLLGPATMMTSQVSDSTLPEPENSETITDVRARIAAILSPLPVLPVDQSEAQSPVSDYEL